MEDGDVQTITDNITDLEKGLTEQMQGICKGLGGLSERVVAVETMVKTEGARCPRREEIQLGVQAKSEVHELAVTMNGKLDGIRTEIGDLSEKVTNNRISIKAWGGLIGSSGGLAALLVWVVENIHL